MSRTAALVLAAGESTRLGSPKQLIDWGGRPLLERVVSAVRRWPVDDVWVVLGYEADAILEACDLGDAGVVVNEDYESGMASSLSVGLDAIIQDGNVGRVIVAMGDQPSVDVGVVAALLERHDETGQMAVVPRYRYTRSNPVVVDQALFGRLMSLEGDVGARQLLAAHPEWVEEVWFESLPPRDVDTKADVEELRPRSGR